MEMLANDKAPPDDGGSIAPPTVSNRQVLGAVTASCMGWALDLFDLFILLFVAPVIGKLFFPSEHAMLSLAAVYASFAVTLLMRPLGSAIFGSYADQRGRKGAMVVAVTGVGMSTAAFGLLPTVGQVGLLAPALFILLRLVQGVFVGGVVASTHTIGTESVPPSWRGAVSGWWAVVVQASAHCSHQSHTWLSRCCFPATLLSRGAGAACSLPASSALCSG
ncbi:hypothetical protein R38712_02227 [Ralstonia pickettii]|jgi:MFS transporter, MHS family, proline/betaine transporter|uniref:Major facilitator superfamily (MFS) profile domain-containing protein n=1 Tax=Ralstonia pickettii TaxID=329 RepID=A0ABN9HZ16_RALPI|nr:hypothetical protein R38712_02227 [Ralstonia pickettii]